jgi:hypothetical protein
LLQLHYVGSLWTTGTFNYIEFHFLALHQGFKTIFLDGGKVDKNVASILFFPNQLQNISLNLAEAVKPHSAQNLFS